MSLQLRPYQKDCVDRAIAKNTIVNLPTGCGKTLVAVRVIQHYLTSSPDRKVAFLVPTRPLVKQQAEYCRQQCNIESHPPVVQTLVGQDQAEWKQVDWDKCLRRSHIFLGTAALFQQAFVTYKYLAISDFSLFVFDECHNAVGNSPMASVMRDGVAPLADCGKTAPRILGLTASFVNGSIKAIEKKRRVLEALLLSTLFCPDVDSNFSPDSFKLVHWKRCDCDSQTHLITKHVEAAVNVVGQVKEIAKVLRRCCHVFQELGYDGLQFYIEKTIVLQIIERAARLKQQNDLSSIACANQMLQRLPVLRSQLKILSEKMGSVLSEQNAMLRSPKLERLIDLLRGLFESKGPEFRGIVFVEQVALVSSLAKELNVSLRGVKCGAVAGTGYQSDKERQAQLNKFKSGEIRILAATATLEEGIDVSTCAFVVRFSSVATTKAHIQGAGRARHPDALVFYFENSPDDERQKELVLMSAAKDQALSLKESDLSAAASAMNLSMYQRHPYPWATARGNVESGAEVNVFNCKQIFNQFCSITLGATIQPKKVLYQYTFLPGGQKVLCKVRFPTREGWRSLTETDYTTFWSSVDFNSIFPMERCRKSSSEKREMSFVYLVVVQLREKGLLDDHNTPDRSIQLAARENCPLSSSWSDAIHFKNKVFQSIS